MASSRSFIALAIAAITVAIAPVEAARYSDRPVVRGTLDRGVDPAVRQELTGHEAEITRLKGRVEQLESELSRLYNLVSGSSTAATEARKSAQTLLNPLESKVATLENDVAALQKHSSATTKGLESVSAATKTNSDSVKSLETALRSIVAAVQQGSGRNSGALADTGGRTYKVRPCDSLGKIAVDQGTSVEALMRRNNLESEDFIVVGQELIIP